MSAHTEQRRSFVGSATPYSVDVADLDAIGTRAQQDGIKIGHECAFCVEPFDAFAPRKGLHGKAALLFCSTGCMELELEDARARREAA
jgi:hypothetical protein